MVLDGCQPSISGEGFCLLQLRIILESFDGVFAPALIACCQVDEKRSVVEGGRGVLEC